MTGPRFFAQALAEYEDVVVYYETREEGLGARQIREFDEAVAVVTEFPAAPASCTRRLLPTGSGGFCLRAFRSSWCTR